MPQVPTYNGAGVAPSSAPGGGFTPTPVQNAAPQQLQQLGEATTRAGAVGTNIINDIQMMANTVRSDDARNKLIEFKQKQTFDPQDGLLSKKGSVALDLDPLGRSLHQQYAEAMQDKINELSGSLANDAQRRMFLEQANQIATQFNGDVASHYLQEYRIYQDKTQDGAIALAANEAELNWNKPDVIDAQVKIAQASVWKKALNSGEPGNLTEAKIRGTTSAIHSKIIAAALQNSNPSYAQRYLEDNKGSMTADDILRVTGMVNHSVDSQVALGAVRSATTKLSSQIQPTDMDRLTNIVRGMESGGNPNAVGPDVPGQGTAKGAMQVMDATAANPGYGVAPVKDNSPEERERVGRELLAAWVKKYGPAQAMAAYNAGPGRLDDAIAAAKKAGSPQNWLSYLPQETQAYVQKGMAKLGAGGGAQPFPTESQFVQSALDTLGDNPRIEQVRLTREQAVAQYAMLDKSRKEQGEQAVTAAQQGLIANGGNFAALSPDIKAAVARYAPDKYENLQGYAAKIANPVSIDNLAAYNQAVAHPEALAKMPDTEFENFITQNFTQSTARALVKERQDQLSETPDLSTQGINRPAVNRAVNNAMVALGIPIAASKGKTFGQAEQERVGGIRAFVDQSIFDVQRQTGQKMTPEQIQQHVAKLFATDVTFKNTLWYGGRGDDTSQKLMAMQLSDLPSGAEAGIRQSLIADGNKSPTNTDILNQYRRLHTENAK